ncbi:TraB/GumN family protein [Pseudoxanthomonas sp.]|uniref:TraB/GumN family protein n=1 Tax=Pseudoxanthomonas sp. TaxID=1871049 RepID=UPI0026359116|nr:TraB/GumN family protein [Pseudoxanthomonas sp.]WDS36434.1 MAG: TraB/GumN family protein [Pseudoxanthomonas sp.]
MFQRCGVLLGLLLAVACPAFAVPAASAPPVPLLWKVTHGQHALYLLGSFHLLKPQDYPLSPEVDAAFADAEQLVLELSSDELTSPALGQAMLAAAQLPAGDSLQQHLEPATWKSLQDYAQANNLPLDALQHLEPWLVATSISVQEMAKQGLDARLGLDMHFIDLARQAGKPVTGLERGQQQIDMLDGMSPAEQEQYLAETLDDSGSTGANETERLHAAWRAGDVATLRDGLAADMKREYPALYQRINVQRNDAWLPKLEARLRGPGDDDTLVVVGALHLLGSDGVVEKLRAKGYDVQRLCNACKQGE